MDTYVISSEERDRLNILKYIAIIFVVYIHSYATDVSFSDGTKTLFLPQWLLLFENLISQTIARCGVPLFFLISSVLFFQKQRDYKTMIKGKVKTLLVPYFIWNSLWILAFILLQNLSLTSSYFSGYQTPILECSFFEWLQLYGIGLDLPYPQDYPLWFMRDLMLINLFFPIIRKAANKYPKQLLVGTVILLLTPIDFPLKQALLWFCIGACIVRLQIHITYFDDVSMWKILPVYIVCALITLLAESAIIAVLFIFLGIIFWARVSKPIFDCQNTRNLFLQLSKWTFIIYVAHEWTLSSLKKLCLRLLPTEPIWLLMEYTVLPVFVIIGCSVVGAMFKRLAPKMYSISTGTR